MKALPEGLTHYKSTAEFTENSIPAALLRSHSTAPDVWGRIKIIEGALLYRMLEPTLEELVLTPAQAGIVEPRALHEVAVLGPVRFCVEFHRMAAPA
ncbi:MAG: DUF1971 domain-containing protein [Telluria sp.]|nr:DUF1971 domain-containing protein [Telluria sp.]